MTEELYDPVETRVALESLDLLSKKLPKPFLVLGGWAVHLTVNHSYRREHGVSYLGSRDVDVCFHIDMSWTASELGGSPFARALEIAREIGYVPTGSFRFCKFIRRSTEEVLTENQSRTVPAYDLHYLFLDLMVDHIHARHGDVFDLDPVDEPLVSRVFENGSAVMVSFGGIEVPIPPPHMLLETKLKSVQGRDREDKAVKDACDIYALLWHSPVAFSEMVSLAKREFPNECAGAASAITSEIARSAAHHLGVAEDSYLKVIGFIHR